MPLQNSLRQFLMREIQLALVQSQRNHGLERDRYIKAFDLAQHHKKDSEMLREDIQLLREQVEQLQQADSSADLAQEHASAVKDLFAMLKLASSNQTITDAVEVLINKMTEAKTSAEMLGSLMREVSELKEQAVLKRRQHNDNILALRTEVDEQKKVLLSRESGDLKQALELSSARGELDEATSKVSGLVED